MQELIAAISQFAGLIEKGGIIAVLIIAIGVAVGEIRRLRADSVIRYAERDKARALAGRYKYALDSHEPPIRVDISDIISQFEGVK